MATETKPPKDPRWDLVIEVIKDFDAGYGALGADEIRPEHTLGGDLGLDSLDHVEVIMDFEERLGLEIPDEDVEDIETVGHVMEYFEQRLGPQFPDENGFLELTEEQFIDRYGPERQANGDLYVQREWSDSEAIIRLAIQEKRCWTLVEDGDEGHTYIEWGNRTVNRLYNIITRRPIEDETWHVSIPEDH